MTNHTVCSRPTLTNAKTITITIISNLNVLLSISYMNTMRYRPTGKKNSSLKNFPLITNFKTCH